MTRHLRLAALLPLAALGGCLPLARLNSDEPFRAADLRLSGPRLRALRVTVHAGQVTLQSSPDDSIEVLASSNVDVDVSQLGNVDLTVVAGELERARVESEVGRVSLAVNGLSVQPQTRPGRGVVGEVSGRAPGGSWFAPAMGLQHCASTRRRSFGTPLLSSA